VHAIGVTELMENRLPDGLSKHVPTGSEKTFTLAGVLA
jgi:hypothetical protein